MSRLDRPDHDLRFEIGFASEQGKRPDNQDFAAARVGRPRADARRATVAAIADGVGGAKGGREAAELTVRCFFDGFFNLPGTLGVRQAAARSLDAVNSWIVAQGHADPKLSGMATTFTALILDRRAGHCVHVGDSRLYRFRDGTLERLTHDHVMGRGEFSHVLRRAVGLEQAVPLDHSQLFVARRALPAVQRRRARPLGDARLREWMALRHAPEPTAQELVAAALAAGGTDNATAMIVDILDTPPADAEEIGDHFGELPVRPAPEVGALVDDYRIDAILADGRYSRLMRAQDLRSGAQVVLKFPQPRVASDKVYRRAFINEDLRRRTRAQPVDRRGDRTAARAPEPALLGHALL